MSRRTIITMAAILGFLGVVAGTFGAHGLEGRIDPALLANYETGVRYHMYHALAMLGLACLVSTPRRSATVAAVLFLLGVVIFSGSLYLLAITGLRWLGAITPIGGTMLLAGWIALAVTGRAIARPDA